MNQITLIRTPFIVQHVLRAEWLEACTRNRTITNKHILHVLELFLPAFPQLGRPTHAPQPVILLNGDGVPPHDHPEWTLLYYPVPGANPAALLVGDCRIIPGAQSAVLMSPNTPHAVEKQTRQEGPRLSIALRWEVP